MKRHETKCSAETAKCSRLPSLPLSTSGKATIMAQPPVILTYKPSVETLKIPSETPLPTETAADLSLPIPKPPFMGSESPALGSPQASYRNSYADSKEILDTKLEKEGSDDEAGVQDNEPPSKAKQRTRILSLAALAVLAILIIVIVVPVYFTVVKPRNRNSESATSSHSGDDTTSAASPTPTSTPVQTTAVFGGDGSEVTATNGTTFTYNKKFGGICE
jgi:glucan 1,3-beta-glucosidase